MYVSVKLILNLGPYMEAGFKREVQHVTERPPPGFESERLAAAYD